MLRWRGVLCAALLVSLVATACVSARPEVPRIAERVVVSDGWLAMGTFFDVDLRVEPGSVDAAQAWLAWTREEVARLEAIYSKYDPESEISALNRALARGELQVEPMAVSRELTSLVRGSAEVWALTGGAFDVTVGPLIDVWQRAVARNAWPSDAELREAKLRSGMERLLLGEKGLRVRGSGMRLDLDGISKGAVLDHLGRDFRTRFAGAAALLSFGQSSILAIGDPDGDGWRLAVTSRDPAVGELARLTLRDRALSVSSSVGSVSAIGGEPVSHVVDARTGHIVRGTVEAVVIAVSAADADAWSTALLVLGARKESVQRVERAELDAYVYESSGRRVASRDWDQFVSF